MLKYAIQRATMLKAVKRKYSLALFRSTSCRFCHLLNDVNALLYLTSVLSSLAKDCGYLPRPLNGSVIGSKTTYPHELQFKCDVGFVIQGSATRKCEADGQWSGEEVKCQGTSKSQSVSHVGIQKFYQIIYFYLVPREAVLFAQLGLSVYFERLFLPFLTFLSTAVL